MFAKNLLHRFGTSEYHRSVVAHRASNRLRVLRAEREITQYDLAIAAGIGMARYWRIEKEYLTPTDAELEALATALGVSIPDLGFLPTQTDVVAP